MPRFGIVQGRLTPSTELQAFPKDWQHEFDIYRDLGFDYIELIAEREYNENNPIWESNAAIIGKIYGSPIVCNDYIINHGVSLVENQMLLYHCSLIGAKMLVLPLMGKAENAGDLVATVQIAEYAANKNIKIGFETIMNYQTNDIPNSWIVYDTGNRSFIKSDMPRDIKRLGDKIGHVHIKDKNEDGENVLLGTGIVNFKEVMQAFKDIGYDGTYTFETVRGKDPIRTAKYNLEFIKFFMSEAQ